MGSLTAHCWFEPRDRNCAQPPRPLIVGMLGQIEEAMREIGMRPVALDCQSWLMPKDLRGGKSCVGKIAIESEPGEPTRSLASWYEWQHPRWRWSREPYPTCVPSIATPIPNVRQPFICEACGKPIENDADRVSGDACDYHRGCVEEIDEPKVKAP